MTYNGKLTLMDRDNIDSLLGGTKSVRQIAKDLDLPYGRVRGYVTYLNRPAAKEPISIEDLASLGLAKPPKGGPAILLFDLETAPALAWVWGAYKTNVIAFEQDRYLLSIGYKWHGKNGTHFVGLNEDPDFEPNTDQDEWLAERLAALLDAADVVIAHNGDRFDVKVANTRLVKHGIDPPSPYRTVDTLKEVRRYFAHMKNNLNELGRNLFNEGKVAHTGFALWKACMAGDPEAWRNMRKYNLKDVDLLEKVYNELRPWIGSPGKAGGPNHNHWSDRPVCPKCGHDQMTKRGFHRTAAAVYQTYQCEHCRGYSRERSREPNAPVAYQ